MVFDQKEYLKKYREDNRDRIREIKKIHYDNNRSGIRAIQSDYYYNNKEKILDQRKDNQYGIIKSRKKYNKKIRMLALRIIDNNLKCVNCGCDDVSIIEINHINGDGNKDRNSGSGSGRNLYRNIINGTRVINDLELRCKLCNILHYIEMKYNIKKFKVSWSD